MEKIADIEEYANENREILKNTSYENVGTFKFKPGHKAFIAGLPKQIQLIKEANKSEHTNNHSFSYILKTLIDTAVSNSEKNPNGFRYNEIIRSFSTYIYLHCGKACYETLCANLPIPSAYSVCEF